MGENSWTKQIFTNTESTLLIPSRAVAVEINSFSEELSSSLHPLLFCLPHLSSLNWVIYNRKVSRRNSSLPVGVQDPRAWGSLLWGTGLKMGCWKTDVLVYLVVQLAESLCEQRQVSHKGRVQPHSSSEWAEVGVQSNCFSIFLLQVPIHATHVQWVPCTYKAAYWALELPC